MPPAPLKIYENITILNRFSENFVCTIFHRDMSWYYAQPEIFKKFPFFVQTSNWNKQDWRKSDQNFDQLPCATLRAWVLQTLLQIQIHLKHKYINIFKHKYKRPDQNFDQLRCATFRAWVLQTLLRIQIHLKNKYNYILKYKYKKPD